MEKILVFDAYPSIRQLLAEELTAEGHVTLSVGKAESLKEEVERFSPDLIVLDLYVRGAILWDLLGELKFRHPKIPILLFTAFHPKEFPRLRQADGWVQKSFLFGELKQKIRDLLQQKKDPSTFGHPILENDSNPIDLPGSSASAALTSAH